MDIYGTWELYDPRTPDNPVAVLMVQPTARSGVLRYMQRDFPLTAVTEMTAQRLRASYAAERFQGTLDAQTLDDDHIEVKFTGNVNVLLRGRRPSTAPPPRPAAPVKPTLSLKAGFLPAVLRDADFQRNGILFGEEQGGDAPKDCRWVVIDPNRHKLEVWQKSSPTQDYVAAGQTLNASVFTNGPFIQYKANTYLAHAGYYAQGAITAFGLSSAPSTDMMRRMDQGWNAAALDWFGGGPVGYVIGSARGVKITKPCAHLGYFGRGTGTDFASYKIGQGDPGTLAEAIGGLFAPGVTDYKIADYESKCQANQWFFWGLAPLAADDARFKETGLADALASYSGAGSAKPVPGLLVGLYYCSSSHAQLLVDIGVKDAVKLDGSDSVLFGHGDTVLVGDSMFDAKRVSHSWGFAFFPQ
jgi:hypothetical protein